jgi:hypothetical protein
MCVHYVYPSRTEYVMLGFGYIISIQTLKRILQVYSNIPFFHLEDVYIGFCVKELGYTFLNLLDFSHYIALGIYRKDIPVVLHKI